MFENYLEHMKNLEEEYQKQLKKNFWLVLSTVNKNMQPHSCVVVYQSDGESIFIQTGKTTVKAKNIMKNNQISVTIPIRKNLMHKFIPAPPAEIHFKGKAELLPFEDEYARKVFKKYLTHELNEEIKAESIWIKVSPSKRINTYGIGVKLWNMRNPTKARKVINLS